MKDKSIIERACEIISQLAKGYNPYTGLPCENESVYTNSDTKAALLLALNSLEIQINNTPTEVEAIPAAETPRQEASDLPADEILFNRLQLLRRSIATQEGCLSYMVFQNRTLLEMARVKPATLTELRGVKGVGDVKLEKYGKVFLAEITQYLGVESKETEISLTQHEDVSGSVVEEVPVSTAESKINITPLPEREHFPPDEPSETLCISCGDFIGKRRLAAIEDTRLCADCARGGEEAKKKRDEKEAALDAQIKAGIICPECHGRLIIKHGKNGQFKGCKNYPDCTYTLPVFWAK